MYFGSVGTVKPNTNGEMHLKKITFHTLVTPRVTPACPPRCSGRHLSNSADLVNLVVAPPFPPSPQPPIHTSRLRHRWRLRRSRRPRARDLHKALACVEDVPLAEMWSQGVFIDRRHGLVVVDLVLQLLVSLANLLAASDRIKSSKLVRRKQQSCALDCALGSTYVSDSLDSSYGGRWSRTLARA